MPEENSGMTKRERNVANNANTIRNAAEVAETLRGNTCGPRATSCADQLSRAITEALNA
jgi:hypothetical protein